MKLTSNLSLKKPDGSDVVNIDDFNTNADTIDKEVQNLKTGKANSKHTHAMGDVGITTSSAVNSTSTTTIANSYAVKQAYDKGNAAALQAETNKNNIANQVKEIESLKQSVVSGKSKIAAAISYKKVPTVATDSFEIMDKNIRAIKSSPPGWDLEELGEVTGSNISENDAIVWQKYGNWDTLIEPLLKQPVIDVGSRNQIAFDKQGKFLAIVGDSAPYINIFKVENDVFTKLPNPTILPSDDCKYCVFSPDGKYLALSMGSFMPIIYSINGDTFTKISIPIPNYSDPVKVIAFSNDGQYFAMGGSDDYFVEILRINSNGTWSGVRSIRSAAYIYNIVFSPDSKFVLFSGDQHSYRFKLSDTTGPQEVSGSFSNAKMSYSNNGDLLVISSSTTKLSVYSVSGETFTELKGVIDVIPADTASSMSFSPDDNYLTVTSNSKYTKSVFIYKRIGNTFKLIDPIGDTIINARYSSISADNKYLALQSNNTTIYRIKEKNMVMNYNIPNLLCVKLKDRYVGYSTESKKVGEQIKVNLFPKFTI